MRIQAVLNEVLSITAQEFLHVESGHAMAFVLNEVLSITAQESVYGVRVGLWDASSMKS